MKAFVIGLSIMMAAAGSRGSAGIGALAKTGAYLPGTGTCAAGAGTYAAGFDAGRLTGFVPAGRDGVTQVGEPDWEMNEDSEADADGESTAPDGVTGETAENGSSETRPEGENPENQAAESAAGGETEADSVDSETVPAEAGAEEPAEEVSGNGRWVSLGDDWVITYYCPLECCNDQWAWQTSTEEPMQLHHTIAVDPSVIPYYTHVRIGGLDYEYVAEDCGGGIKGKRIDVLVENCDLANELGVDRNIEVWVETP